MGLTSTVAFMLEKSCWKKIGVIWSDTFFEMSNFKYFQVRQSIDKYFRVFLSALEYF